MSTRFKAGCKGKYSFFGNGALDHKRHSPAVFVPGRLVRCGDSPFAGTLDSHSDLYPGSEANLVSDARPVVRKSLLTDMEGQIQVLQEHA